MFPLWFSMFLSISLFSSYDIDVVIDADHFTLVNLRETTVYHMIKAQELTAAHAMNLAFVHDLPEAQHVLLLAILTSSAPEARALGPASIEQHHYRNSPAAFV
jgi:hypothetical protein